MLQQDLDNAREQIENSRKHHDDLELKSKADVKLLVKEVKSLRSYQSELKQELSRLTKEKLEVEVASSVYTLAMLTFCFSFLNRASPFITKSAAPLGPCVFSVLIAFF